MLRSSKTSIPLRCFSMFLFVCAALSCRLLGHCWFLLGVSCRFVGFYIAFYWFCLGKTIVFACLCGSVLSFAGFLLVSAGFVSPFCWVLHCFLLVLLRQNDRFCLSMRLFLVVCWVFARFCWVFLVVLLGFTLLFIGFA